ncbi:unnamed protein product [Closterium sp. Naga37s-1]|nr:unnamed protein product [Closterium sp. Naga37s-1]
MRPVVLLLLLHACLLSSHRLATARTPLAEADGAASSSSRRELQASCPAGVVCPTGATCVVDGSGYPFCKCAAGQAIINGVCAPAASWATVGTNVVLYNRASYTNYPKTLAPAVLRGAAPNSSACVNLPAAFNGTVGSVRIMWNVNDGVADHLVCGKLFFWDKPNCCCSGSGYQIPGGWTAVNPNTYTYTTTSVKSTSGVIAVGRSISCQAAIATNTYPCATKNCPVNAACSVVNGAAVCTCNAGYSMVGGQCVATTSNPCTGYTCPANSACSNVNGAATCTCNTGYQMVNGQCVVPNPCTGYTCPANSACSNVNGVATCTCNTGYQMVNGQCVGLSASSPLHCLPASCAVLPITSDVNVPNPCTGYTCPANSACSNVNGVATCTCNTGYQMVNGQCVVPNPCTGYTCPANSACSNVNGVATCTCNAGYQMVNGQCVVPNPCTGYTCPANSACSNVNGVATCTCNTGYQMVNGQCVVPNPCTGYTCPANSACSNVNGVATCTCSAGYQMVNGQCVVPNPCTGYTCPANSACSNVNGVATCTCSAGYQMTAGQCVAITDPCTTTTCPAKATCSSVNGVATCVCAVGYTLVSGACQPAAPCSLVKCPANCTCSSASGVAKCDCPTDLCYGVKCPDVSKCTYMLGAPVCTCPPPYTRLIDNKCTNGPCCSHPALLPSSLLARLISCPPAMLSALHYSKPFFLSLIPPCLAPACHAATLAFSDYLDNQNAARAAVGAIPLVWNASRDVVLTCPLQTDCMPPAASNSNPHSSLSMSPLPAHLAVAAEAQAWATTLTNSTYNCGLSHGGNPGEGQNLSGGGPAGYYSNGAAVSWWVGEGDLYSYAVFSGGCSTGNWADCGHYTQVIWNNTRTVGCGKASCGTKADVWACNYYPPGNYGGQLPYVQDPCYRVACPSTATCTVRYGQPMCVCGAGQVLVNNATCQPDPCTTATTTCPGNLVCDGSSGSAQCACPTGLVPISANTCVPPACVGAVCPAQATCAVDGSGYPFCQCPTGWYMGSNVCVQGVPAAVAATSLAIYNTASYTSTAPALGPTLVRTGLPVNSSRGSCVDIPGGIAAASLRVLWNVPDSTGAPKQSCGLLWFWTSASCYGSATGYYRPAGDQQLSFYCGGPLPSLSPQYSPLTGVLCPSPCLLCACSTTSGNVALVKAVACAI